MACRKQDDRDERIEASLSVDGIGHYFGEKPDALRPHRIYEAKTAARIDCSQNQQQLFSNFVDPDLLPFVERLERGRLTSTVVSPLKNPRTAMPPGA